MEIYRTLIGMSRVRFFLLTYIVKHADSYIMQYLALTRAIILVLEQRPAAREGREPIRKWEKG